MQTVNAFLLTRQWRDTAQGLELEFWAASDRGPVRVTVSGERAVCFVSRDVDLPPQADPVERKTVALRSLEGVPVDALYFRQQRDLNEFRGLMQGRGERLYESDLKPSDRFLMERFITAGFAIHGVATERDGFLDFHNPALRKAEYARELSYVSLDIETEGFDGALYSIAVDGPQGTTVLMVSSDSFDLERARVICCPDERTLLETFLTWFAECDPDLVLGWNVINFDLDFLERKCRQLGLAFTLGRDQARATVLQAQGQNQVRVARVPGRVVLDGISTLRAATWSFENFALESVAQTLLGRGKLIHGETDKLAEIQRLYRDDKAALAEYNLADCRLVIDVFAKTDLLNFALQRSEMTGLAMDRQGGSVAAFDNLYLPRLHRRGYVAADVGARSDAVTSPGGHVMDSEPGLYDNVLVLDFKSLYPSIIRTFGIDPLGLAEPGEDPIPGFLQAQFAREGAILPELIGTLWQARDVAKRSRNAAMSQAIKILMNSFYGVLGASGCRFYDARLASSITRRGHEIITRSRSFIEARGYKVIYGDTDSLFVLSGRDDDESSARAAGTELSLALNNWWTDVLATEYRLQSSLEIEFETHYLRFLMPTVRGTDKGSKKRYAGYVRRDDGEFELIFKGLESVRSDWTPLARQFQRELYRRVFFHEPYEDYARTTVAALRAGELDDQLVYRKRLGRRLEDYTRNVPPHVQAARKQRQPRRWISYVVTRNGPEPTDELRSAPDYDHYVEKQLAPVADSILYFLDTSFNELTDAQLGIF